MLKKPNALSQGKSHVEMTKTVANARNADGGSSASDLDYNYHQLYGKCQKMKEDASKTTFLDEDPVGDCVTMNRKDSQTNASTNRSSEETFVFNPTCKMPQPEFKWNPIILENSPKKNSPLSWLTSQTSSEQDSHEQYHNAHHNQRFLRRNLPPEYEFRKQFSGNCQTYEPDQDRPPSYYETEFHSSQRNLPFFNRSSSPESWEISSNSSGQTIAEVSHILIKHFVKLFCQYPYTSLLNQNISYKQDKIKLKVPVSSIIDLDRSLNSLLIDISHFFKHKIV